jgi:hypothetical protein
MSPLEQNASDSPVITDITAAADNADPEVGAAAVPDLPVDAQRLYLPGHPQPGVTYVLSSSPCSVTNSTPVMKHKSIALL